jgi:hypothetical protein
MNVINSSSYDVVVAGGGISGCMAAVAAAREGAKTLIIERFGALGGMSTLGLVQPITTWGLKGEYVIGGTGRRFLTRLAEISPYASTPVTTYGPTCDTEYLKIELERLCFENDVHILYYGWIRDVIKDGNDRISKVIVLTKEGLKIVVVFHNLYRRHVMIRFIENVFFLGGKISNFAYYFAGNKHNVFKDFRLIRTQEFGNIDLLRRETVELSQSVFYLVGLLLQFRIQTDQIEIFQRNHSGVHSFLFSDRYVHRLNIPILCFPDFHYVMNFLQNFF